MQPKYLFPYILNIIRNGKCAIMINQKQSNINWTIIGSEETTHCNVTLENLTLTNSQ